MGNTLTINIALTPTLHNDMLIIKEDLYLPSFSIQLCNSDCVNREVVSEEPIDLSVSKVLIHNKSEIVRILLEV